MKKFAKLSLVAALAIAGTTASAANLADAIQNVDVSGQFRYRFQEASDSVGAGNTGSDVEIEVTAKVPVNDNVTAVFKIDNVNDDTDAVAKGNVQIEDYYFQYVDGALTVLAGQQNIPGRMTDGAQGDGVVALYNLGDFTVGAAAFATNNVDTTDVGLAGRFTGNNVTSVIAMGSVGPVSLLAQYADVDEVMDAYNLKADASIEGIKVGAEYTAAELDASVATALAVTADDRSTLKAYVSGSIDMLTATLSYGKTGDAGSGSIDNQTDAQVETPAELLVWNLGTAGNADMDLIVLDASVALTDAVSLRAAYASGEIGSLAGNDVEEILGQISYKVSSNLNTYIRYSQFDNSATSDTLDSERARIEVKYSF